MNRAGWLLAIVIVLLALSTPALAADEEPTIEFAYPLVTRRPVIERELDVKAFHVKTADGRVTVLAPEVEWPILPRWQIEVAVPIVMSAPRDRAAETGVGDVEIENKLQLFKSVQHRTLVAAGVEVKFPTGSERRGLGGEAAIEPFLSAGTALGPLDLIAEVAYEWNVNAHVKGENEQELTAGAMVAYPISRWFTPLVELTTVTRTRGTEEEAEGGARLKNRPQVYLTPGVNARPLPGTTLRLGVQLPVTSARKFDYTLHAGFVVEF
jgi:hypothetical protein